MPPALQELPVPEGYFVALGGTRFFTALSELPVQQGYSVALGDFLFYSNKFFWHFHFRGVMRSHLPDTNWFNLAVKLYVKLNAATRSPGTSSSGGIFCRLGRLPLLW